MALKSGDIIGRSTATKYKSGTVVGVDNSSIEELQKRKDFLNQQAQLKAGMKAMEDEMLFPISKRKIPDLMVGRVLSKIDNDKYVSAGEIDSATKVLNKKSQGWAAKKNPTYSEVNASAISEVLTNRKNYYSLFEDEQDYKKNKANIDNQIKYADYSFDDLQNEISALEKKRASAPDYKTKSSYNQEIDWLKNFSVIRRYSTEKEYDDAINKLKLQIKDYENGGVFTGRGLVGGSDPNLGKIDALQEQIQVLEIGKSKLKRQLELNEKYYYLLDNPDFQNVLENRSKFNKAVAEEKLPSIEGSPNAEVKLSGVEPNHLSDIVIPDNMKNLWYQTTDDEKKLFVYLSSTKGKKAALDFLKDIEVELSERDEQFWINLKVTEFKEGNAWDKIKMNLVSIPQSVFGNIIAGGADIVSLLQNGTINPYSSAHGLQQEANAIRQVTSEEIDEKIDSDFLSSVATYAYQGVMSGADMTLGGLTLGSFGYSASMALGTFSSQARSLYERGESVSTIAFGAAVAAAIELGTEYIGVDTFLNTFNSKSGKSFWKNLLIQLGAEPTEETIAKLGNLAADSLITGQNSEMSIKIRDYISRGMSKEEARKKASAEFSTEMFWEAFSAIASVGFSSIGSAAKYGAYKASVNRSINKTAQGIVENGNVDLLLETVISLPSDTKAYKMAEAFEENSKTDTKRVAKLYSETIDEINTQIGNKTKIAIATRLQELGETVSAEKTAETILKMARMEDIENSEIRAIKKNSAANTVYNELIGESEDKPDWIETLAAETSGLSQMRNFVAVSGELPNSSLQKVKNQLQSSASGGIINSNGGVDNVISDERTVDTSVEGIRKRFFTKDSAGRHTPETAEAFAERAGRVGLEGSRKKRSLLTNGKSSIAYTLSDSDTPLNRFVQKLRAIGIDTYCCEGVIETNVDGVTTTHTEALTTSQGKIFFCESSALANKEKADHELVHHSWRQLDNSYLEYEDILINNLNRESNYYIAFCIELNKREFNNAYDVETIEGAALFDAELTAYVYQNVLNDRAFADKFFSNMFDNWDEVVNAVYTFNSQKEIDTNELTPADSNGSASFMPENEAQEGFETQEDTNTNNPENRLQGENEGDLGGSFFDEPSVDFPEADFIADMGARVAGVERHSDGQRLFIGIARKLGYRVVFDSNLKTETGAPARGRIDYDKKTIYLNPKTDKPLQFTFGHELTHYGESSELYDEFITAIRTSKVYLQWLKNKTSSTSDSIGELEGLYRERVMASRKNAAPVGAAEAQQEMYADFCGETFFSDNESGLKRLMDGLDRKHHSKVIQFVLDFVSYLKEKLSGNKQITLELVKLESRYTELLKSAKENTTQESGVKYDIYNHRGNLIEVEWDSDNFSSLSQQLKEHLEKVNSMSPVANVLYTPTTGEKLYHQVVEEYKKIGFKVDVQNFGIIELDENAIQLGVNSYINTNAEAAALLSIPKVLKRGKIISGHQNHKNRNYPTITFAAPVVLNGKVGNVVVAVKVTGKTRYNAHRVLMPDGTEFILDYKKNTEPQSARMTDIKEGQRSAKGSVSNNKVTQDEPIVKKNSMQKNEKYSIAVEEEQSETTDFTVAMRGLTARLKNGEISQEDFLYLLDELYGEAQNKYGNIPKGESVTGKENFDTPVPRQVEPNRNVGRYARTIIEGGQLTDDMLDNTKQQILSGELSYTPTSNEKVIQRAQTRMASGKAAEDWNRVVLGDRMPSAVDIAVGELLLKQAIESKDAVRVVELTAELVEVGTRLGQAVQALSLLKRMDGISQLTYVQKCVNNLNRDLEKRFGKKFGGKISEIKVNEILAKQLAESKTPEDFEITYASIMEDIAAQVPSTFLDKWNAWRYMAMLVNPTTHLRNLYGNAVFVPAIRIKNALAAIGELAVDRDQRTKSVVVKKEYKAFAKSDFANVEAALTGTGKMNPKTGIADNKRIFKNGVLESIRTKNSEWLEKEDIIFLKYHYTHALGGYLQAQKVNLENVSYAVLRKARSYAINEALKATYRDASKLANVLSQASNSNIFANVIIEGTLPFKKTPINIVKRGVEYSPLGLAKTIGKAVYDLNQGTYTATEFIDGLAANFTGTVIMLIGMSLAGSGILAGGMDDDDEDWFRRLMGEQEYSVRIGNKSYTIDWMCPAAIPLFIGVAIAETWKEDSSGSVVQALLSALGSGIEPIVNLSMLSGLNDTISSVRYSDADTIMQSLVGNIIGNYFSQAVPTIGGKVANTVDDTRRTTFIDKNSDVPKWLQSAVDTVIKKTPVLSKSRQEYINAWGETEKTGNAVERFISNFASPGYFSEVEKTEISDELQRLAKSTGESSVYPDNAPRTYSFKGYQKHLSRDEYTIYATQKGQMQTDYLREAVQSDSYDALTDEQKVKVITNLYKFANAKAKSKISYSYEELNLLQNGAVTEEQYNRLSEKARKSLAEEYFLSDYKKVSNYERNGGSAVDYYVRRAI